MRVKNEENLWKESYYHTEKGNFSEESRQLESSLINETTHSFSLSRIVSQTVKYKLPNTACGQIYVAAPEGSA